MLMSVETHSQLDVSAVKDLVFTFLGRFPLKGMVTEQEIVQIAPKRTLRLRQFPLIDPKRLLIANTKGGAVCEKCSRPLVCMRCQHGGNAAASRAHRGGSGSTSGLNSTGGVRRSQPSPESSAKSPSAAAHLAFQKRTSMGKQLGRIPSGSASSLAQSDGV